MLHVDLEPAVYTLWFLNPEDKVKKIIPTVLLYQYVLCVIKYGHKIQIVKKRIKKQIIMF